MQKRIFGPSNYFIVAVGFITLIMAGCLGGLKQAPPEKRYYVLKAARPDTPVPSHTLDANLKVRDFRVSPDYAGRELIYRTGQNAYESDYYNGFLVPPSRMITQTTRLWFNDSGLFRHVTIPGSDVDAEYILEGAVTCLYGDFTISKTPHSVLEIQFFLTKDAPSGYEILFDKTYREERPLQTKSPAGLVASLNSSLDTILSDLEKDIRQALSARR